MADERPESWQQRRILVADFEVGRPLKGDKVDTWARHAEAVLMEGEPILAMHSGLRVKPGTELAIITPARVLLAETASGAFGVKLEYRLADVVEVRANKMGMNGQVQLVMANGDKEKFGTAGVLSAKTDAAACAAAIERARQHPAGPALSAALPPPPPGPRYQPTGAPPRVPNKYEAKAAEYEARSAAARDEYRDAKAARKAAKEAGPADGLPDTALGPDVQTVGGLPSTKAIKVINAHCLPDEHPWLVINASVGGVLAAFDDRLMVIKTGAMTSFMTGSLGGGRVATFHYVDVTGIEYNSGLANGVLEVLTPSYSGGAQKDFWKGSNKSRNADSNDPFTLSNTLPLPRAIHAQAQPHLNELRSRIAAAKRTVVVAQPPPPPPAPSGGGLAAELAELATLRDAGVLSEEEFAAAKAKLLGS